jgi:transcriptional regulator with XRE-family HTH domain
MPADNTPASKGSPRKVFGKMLRFHRDQAGVSREELAPHAHISVHTLRAYEEGRRVPPRQVVALIEDHPTMRSEGALLALWDEYEESMSYVAFPEWVADWFEDVEPSANRIRNAEPSLVPGLLQTENYATSLARTRDGITEDEITERVQAKMRRQRILDRDDPAPPTVRFIIDEWALRRPIGGPQVMHEQILHLIEMAKRPNIIIRILPAGVGAHEGLSGGGIAIAEFDDADKPTIAYQEGNIRGGHLIKDRRDVAILEAVWDSLRDEALPQGASLTKLEETAESWTSPT